MVVFCVLRCITIWLPFRRTSENPRRERMAHTSRPDRTRSLPNLYLESGDEHFSVPSALDLTFVGGFQEQFNRFLQILAGGFDAVALTGNVKLGAQSDIAIAFDNRRELLHCLHMPPIRTF